MFSWPVSFFKISIAISINRLIQSRAQARQIRQNKHLGLSVHDNDDDNDDDSDCMY